MLWEENLKLIQGLMTQEITHKVCMLYMTSLVLWYVSTLLCSCKVPDPFS